MKPDERLITIHNNPEQIKALLNELVLIPRINAIKWSLITKQTANIKIGYPGQHLASLVTGMEGERTGARGNDLADGSEVKSCSRIDQLDICLDCRAAVSRLETVCPQCNSQNIHRNNDSKWLFTIRNEADLNLLLNGIDRVLLIMGDYANFEKNDYETLRFQSFEIWPKDPRNARFGEIMSNYYYKIFLEHKKGNPNKTPAPKNFWPYQYQFYICNPIPTFRALVYHANTEPVIDVDYYVNPGHDRANLPSVPMPSEILEPSEFQTIIRSAPDQSLVNALPPSLKDKLSAVQIRSMSHRELTSTFPLINEELKNPLPLRDTDRISTARTAYSRRKRFNQEEA